MSRFLAAAIQMASTASREENLRTAGLLLDQAAARGARLAVLPEYLHNVSDRSREAAEEIPGGPTFRFFSQKAAQLNMWIHCGSVFEQNADALPYNTSMLIAPDGTLAATYRKLHLCDLEVPASGIYARESDRMTQGGTPTVYDAPGLGRLGFSTCYDLRFPELYRCMALDGAEIFLVPSDFGWRTGRAHRELLLRARALENACYVIAAQQCYEGSCGETMIIDPWGTVIARTDLLPGVITAEIDTDFARSTGENLGIFANRRTDLYHIGWTGQPR